MTDTPAPARSKPYRLRERTTQFALQVRQFTSRIAVEPNLPDDLRALLNASGAIGAGYIAADDAASKRGFVSHIRRCCTECKLCIYWLRLLDLRGREDLVKRRAKLLGEAQELMLIFNAIAEKVDKKK